MSTENYSNYLQNKDLDNFSKTGYSNSRLSGNFFTTPQPELSFDAMTIVGNLNKTNA
ncbi:replication initiation protein, partial [Staphylococcus aureus]|nr:replication initiation protein [Staphylococcus aureus]